MEALFTANDDVGAGEKASAAEASALLAAFVMLKDPQARRRILDAAEGELEAASATSHRPS